MHRGIAGNISELTGETPLVLLDKLALGGSAHGKARVAAKLEFMEPCRSQRDRVARAALESAELAAGPSFDSERSMFVCAAYGSHEATSLACMAAARGRRLGLVLTAAAATVETRMLVRAFGAQLWLTDPELGAKGAVERARRIAETTPGAILLERDPEAQAREFGRTTGAEIWRDTLGTVDIVVAGVGTGSSLVGIGGFLKSQKQSVRVVGVEPAEVPAVSGRLDPALLQGAPAASVDPAVQLCLTSEPAALDEVVRVSRGEAQAMAHRLALQHGLLVDLPAGAAVAAALSLAERPGNAECLVVVIIPSFGERSLSKAMFKPFLSGSVPPLLAEQQGSMPVGPEPEFYL